MQVLWQNSIGKVLNLQRYPTPTTIGVNGGLDIATDPGLHQVRAHAVEISRVLRYFPESHNFALMVCNGPIGHVSGSEVSVADLI